MPGMNGCDVLRTLKSDPGLRSIPVIVLSTSQAMRDVTACYAEHANAYVSKGADLESNLKLLRDIDRFWGDSAVLPR
jgi:CheY-like chemotaxis protein